MLHFLGGTGGAGVQPLAGVVVPDGAYYGTTPAGGDHGSGTAFRLDADGNERRLHPFDPASGDGHAPRGALVVGADGRLWGTTEDGGAHGLGSVYAIGIDGAYQRVHDSDGSSGAAPRASPAGALTVPHAFAPSAGGYGGPGDAGVVVAAGVVHGTTLGDAGGLPASGSAGSVWRLAPGPSGHQKLHRFAGTDGTLPGSQRRSGDGRLYGVTRGGGCTLLRIGADGRLVGTAFASTVPPRFGRPDPRNGGGAVFALYPRAPRVQLTVTPAFAAAGSPVTPSWQADNGADGCTAGGSWRGAREARGSVTVPAPRPGELTYRLDCSNPAGTGSSSVVVTPAERGGNRYGLRCSGAGGESLATVSVFRSGTP